MEEIQDYRAFKMTYLISDNSIIKCCVYFLKNRADERLKNSSLLTDFSLHFLAACVVIGGSLVSSHGQACDSRL